ncbi:hypothetical protein Curi_c13950 [Gottschalkia acidurici 9a]|uniref:Uncharacterized protein n=1 Tax=Gottschalkia acidurici (strain ATCC 7906 / DSM 604 / BCRC 14475 / CIP 104303 / KCTC 5404 / NCIMB 10678 / 9a) TaxID=1128398 RepID=K0B0I5_GOTA9|nr:hypothetical protein [Gottschalkia acidurici]AFS78405.1 hypothetical protein Curi_c13950 [Gottschalkia acidurici 9a]
MDNGLPFMIIYRKRSNDEILSHNVYYLPWLDGKKWKEYIRDHHLSINTTLIKEYEEELYKQIYDNQATEKLTNIKRDRIFISYINKTAKKLSKIGVDEVLKILASIGERIIK